MGHKRLSRYGTIRGGRCDQIHAGRMRRVDGANWLLRLLEDKGHLVNKKGWWRIISMPELGWRKIAKIGTKANGRGAEWQIGVFRFKQDVIKQLHDDKRAFRWDWIVIWLEAICSFEFGFDAPTPLGPYTGRYQPPHAAGIFDKKRASGEFKKGRSDEENRKKETVYP